MQDESCSHMMLRTEGVAADRETTETNRLTDSLCQCQALIDRSIGQPIVARNAQRACVRQLLYNRMAAHRVRTVFRAALRSAIEFAAVSLSKAGGAYWLKFNTNGRCPVRASSVALKRFGFIARISATFDETSAGVLAYRRLTVGLVWRRRSPPVRLLTACNR